MACGEFGPGRLPEPAAIIAAGSAAHFAGREADARPARRQARARHRRADARADRPGALHRQPLVGQAGLRHRRRRRRGGRAGDAGRRAGRAATPAGVARIDVESAEEMAAAVKQALPADAAVMVAAVADWRVEPARPKIKKPRPAALRFARTPTSSPTLGAQPSRPRLLIGFAAETEDVVANAERKRGQGRRLDRRQRRVGRRDGRRRQQRPPRHRRGRRGLARGQGRGRAPAGRADRRGDSHDHRDHASPACRTATVCRCPAMPRQARPGMDVVAAEDLTLAPGARHAVATGFAIAIPQATKSRSGRARASRSSTASPASTRRARSTATIAAR